MKSKILHVCAMALACNGGALLASDQREFTKAADERQLALFYAKEPFCEVRCRLRDRNARFTIWRFVDFAASFDFRKAIGITLVGTTRSMVE